MIGGEEEVFNANKALLEDISKALHFVGPAGKASEVKALVNMVMNINTAALAEGLALGQALGLDLSMLREVFSQTGAASRVLQTDGAETIQFPLLWNMLNRKMLALSDGLIPENSIPMKKPLKQ